jgi:predicted ester cyclase
VSEAAEKNKALVRRLYDAQTKGDLYAMRELLTPDFGDNWLAPGQEAPGREGYIQSNAAVHAAFSDVSYVIEEQMAAEGDRVVSRLTIRGTLDRGEFMGFAPTGKEHETGAIVIHRIVGGKIAEEWWEGSGLLELTQARLEKEIRERERVEQELQVARRIQHALLPKEVPTLEGWEIPPSICQLEGGWRRLLRLPGAAQRTLRHCRRRRNGQGRACGPGDGQRPQHPTSLPAQGGAHSRELADHSLLPTSPRGRRRLLRLPPPL